MRIIAIKLFIIMILCTRCTPSVREYDIISTFEDGFAEVAVNHRVGLIDTNGTEVIPCQYISIYRRTENLFEVTQRDKEGNEVGGVYDIVKGKEILPCKYPDYSVSFDEDLKLISVGGMGYIDFDGKEVIQPIYSDIKWDDGKNVAKATINRKYGYFDNTGKILIPFEYQDIGNYSKGLIKAKKENLWGYIDHHNNEIISFKYDTISNFNGDLACFKIYNSYGIVSKNNVEIIPSIYQEPIYFDGDVAVVKYDNKYGIVNKEGKITARCIYRGIKHSDFIYEEEEYYDDYPIQIIKEFAIVNYNGKHGIINNKTGKKITDFVYDAVGDYNEKMVIFELNGKYGIVSLHGGKTIVPFDYEFITNIGEELFIAKQNDKCGVINSQEKTVIPFQYDQLSVGATESYIAIIGNKYGLLDSNGKLIIPPVYDNIEPYDDNIFWVSNNNQAGIIDATSGKELIPCKYDDINFQENIIIVQKNQKYGIYSKNGELISPCQYDTIEDFNIGKTAIVKKNEKYGLIDKQGKEVLSCRYDHIFDREKKYYLLICEEKQGIADMNGQIVFPLKYDEIQDWSWPDTGKYMEVCIDGKCGLSDKKGNLIIPCKYDDVFAYNDKNVVEVKLADKKAIFNKEGKVLIPFGHYFFSAVDSLIIKVYDDDKDISYLIKNGIKINKKEYEEYEGKYIEGLLAVKDTSNKWGFIDTNGNEVIPCIYDEVTPFIKGVAVVCLNKKWFYIDKNMKNLLPVKGLYFIDQSITQTSLEYEFER